VNIQEAWEKCQRGDWMLQLASRQEVDIQKLTLAKVRCARLVEHLMIDERSTHALDVAEAFAAGEATREELKGAAAAAYVAADLAAKDAAAYADAAIGHAAYVAAVLAACAAEAAVYVAYDAADLAPDAEANLIELGAEAAAKAAAVGHAAYTATKQDILRQAADITREVIAFGDLGL